MPEEVRWVLADFAEKEFGRMKRLDKAKLVGQMFGALLLVVGLVMHFADVGFIGLMIVVVLTSLNGITVEHDIAHAFLESMPFVSLLVVFLGVVGMIHDQHLFEPIIQYVLGLEDKTQLDVLYLVNGVLSAVSDNVFVATVFVEQLEKAFIVNGTFVGDDPAKTKLQYDRLSTAIIAGTNLPSMFTPNGQAALLFILSGPDVVHRTPHPPELPQDDGHDAALRACLRFLWRPRRLFLAVGHVEGGEEVEEEEEEEEGLFKADAVNEEDPERDRATQV